MGDRSSRTDELRDRWENLGIAFSVHNMPLINVDPEMTLVSSFKEFYDDRKLVGLILSWLQEFGDLVHVERLKSLAGNLTAFEYAWLGGLAHHQLATSNSAAHRRWQVIVELAKRKLGEVMPQFPTRKLDELQVERNGADENFKRFGILIPKIEIAPAKKIRIRPQVLRDNLWFRMRLLFGTNWRADIATAMLLDLAKTSYQLERVLGCSRETAYRNWNALTEVDIRALLKSA